MHTLWSTISCILEKMPEIFWFFVKKLFNFWFFLIFLNTYRYFWVFFLFYEIISQRNLFLRRFASAVRLDLLPVSRTTQKWTRIGSARSIECKEIVDLRDCVTVSVSMCARSQFHTSWCWKIWYSRTNAFVMRFGLTLRKNSECMLPCIHNFIFNT